MGFGYGQTTYWSDSASKPDGTRARKVYDASMVAHIWNAQSQNFARTSNGNFAFRGDTLYSYGTRWIVAKLFAGAALINSERVSVTTSSHESDAWHASSNRPRFDLPGLPDSLARRLDEISDAMGRGDKSFARNRVRQMLANDDYLEAMQGREIAPMGARWSRVPTGRTLGEFLCAYVGLRPAVAFNAAAKLIKARERKAAEEARKEKARFIRDAIIAADMPDSEWREKTSIRDATTWNGERHLRERAKELRGFRLKAGLSKTRNRKLWEREKGLRAVAADFSRLHAIANRRSRLASLVRYARQMSNVTSRPEPLAEWSSNTWRTIRDNASELGQCAMLPAATRERLAVISEAAKGEALAAEQREFDRREQERKERKENRIREAAEREARIIEHRRAWLAGEAMEGGFSLGSNFQREDGTPYLRVYGDELQTSWGATVPLGHAVKVFRFVKLCRERGESWRRNGKTIRVGHFQVDAIEPNGDFVAGCHRFAWDEIERAAIMAGVASESASAEALESKESA